MIATFDYAAGHCPDPYQIAISNGTLADVAQQNCGIMTDIAGTNVTYNLAWAFRNMISIVPPESGPFTCPVTTAPATLVWDYNDPTVTSYKLYWGIASRTYSNSMVVGNVLQATIPNLNIGTTYYFAVTASNSHGESAYSNEVSQRVTTTGIRKAIHIK